MRQIVLDTETTGLDPAQGHKLIEVGCVELVDRRPRAKRRWLINPEREIDAGAVAVHGITLAQLADKPAFRDIADELIGFIRDAELIIHNAAFDVGFLDAEFAAAGRSERIAALCAVRDTLALARELHPGQKNSLDALCKRYEVDNSGRTLHGALLDAEILVDVYLAMTGGQAALSLDASADDGPERATVSVSGLDRRDLRLVVHQASPAERARHDARLAEVRKAAGGIAVWDSLDD